MKNKSIYICSFLLISLFVFAHPTWALTLDSIGSSATTNGNPGTDWYFTSTNPRLSGTAAANSNVSISIDGTQYTITADTNGNWAFTPTTLTTGDHTVIIAGDNTSMTFTLHIGQSAPSTTSKGGTASGSALPETLPQTGALSNTLLVLGGGFGLVLVGLKLGKLTQ